MIKEMEDLICDFFVQYLEEQADYYELYYHMTEEDKVKKRLHIQIAYQRYEAVLTSYYVVFKKENCYRDKRGYFKITTLFPFGGPVAAYAELEKDPRWLKAYERWLKAYERWREEKS